MIVGMPLAEQISFISKARQVTLPATGAKPAIDKVTIDPTGNGAEIIIRQLWSEISANLTEITSPAFVSDAFFRTIDARMAEPLSQPRQSGGKGNNFEYAIEHPSSRDERAIQCLTGSYRIVLTLREAPQPIGLRTA